MTEKTLAERIAEERLEKTQAQPFNVKWIAKNLERLRFDLAIQRNNVWNDDQKSLLIHSILTGYPIPPVYTVKSDDKQFWLLDGKQRISTLAAFRNDLFELSNDTPEAFGVELAGFKFSQLPEEFQDLISDHNMVFYQFEEIDSVQISELFLRLNGGSPLTQIELNRAVIGTDNMNFIDEIVNTDFFKYVSFSEKQVNRFVDQELIIQVLKVLDDQYDLSGKELKNYAFQLRDRGISDEVKELIRNACGYLSAAFAKVEEKKRKRILKKNDIVALFGIVKYYMDNNTDAEKFGESIVEFLVKPSQRYKDTKTNGSAKAEKVEARINTLKAEIGSRLS